MYLRYNYTNMGLRGPKPKGKVKMEWSSDFAYAIGLIASDGNLSPDGRHILFVSKDEELVHLFIEALKVDANIGKRSGNDKKEKKYHVVQIGDVLFYKFLLSIGLMPNKSKIIGKLAIPTDYFFDFLRGSFDGDGCTYSYWDSRWRSSFMFYTVFVSASKAHVLWIQKNVKHHLGITGQITGRGQKGTVYQLKYGKADSLQLLHRLFPNRGTQSLTRKRLKINEMLRIINARQV